MAEAQRLTRLAFRPCSLHLLTSLVLEIDQVRINAMEADFAQWRIEVQLYMDLCKFLSHLQEIARARLRLDMSLRSIGASPVMIESLLRSIRLFLFLLQA